MDNIEQKLKPLRERIDAIDAEILTLLNQRAQTAQAVGHIKAETNAAIFRPERETQVLRSITERNPGPLRDINIHTIFSEIMSACRALEKKLTVAFLGPVGTYSEQAVHQQFGTVIDSVPCASIEEVFRSTEAGTADFGMVPVENSAEGAVNRTLDLFLHMSLYISGELSIPVHHNLMAQQNNMDGITRICAHSQALAQCQGWLSQHYPDIEQQAVSSNGEAARIAKEDPTVAAVASEIAARKYDLQIIARHIQDDPHNRTRFVTIGRSKTTPTGRDQTSLILSVPNRAGAVYDLLAPLARHGVSMTRFESRPARMGAWEYYFYVDIEGHTQDPRVAAGLVELEKNAAFFKILGSYPLAIQEL